MVCFHITFFTILFDDGKKDVLDFFVLFLKNFKTIFHSFLLFFHKKFKYCFKLVKKL